MTLRYIVNATRLFVRRCIARPVLSALAAIGVVLALTPAAHAADVDAVRLWRAPDHTRVVLDLSGSADFSTLSLENPERFVVDLSQSQLKASLKSLPLEGTLCLCPTSPDPCLGSRARLGLHQS